MKFPYNKCERGKFVKKRKEYFKNNIYTYYPHTCARTCAHIYPHFIEKILSIWYNLRTEKQDEYDSERGDGMWYGALEVARYIITHCFEEGKPVSNLKLQKMLYFLWVEFYKRTGRMLFSDYICAWQLGPVVPGVYYEFCSYAGSPICGLYATTIESDDAEEMDAIISEYIDIPANVLVNRTHKPGTAWDIVYENGAGNRKVIPFELIIKREVG